MRLIIIFAFSTILFSCGESKDNKDKQRVNELIERERKRLRDDSIIKSRQLKIDEALIRAGKKPKYFVDTTQ